MKKSVYVKLGILGVSLALAFGAGTVMAQDVAKLSPTDIKVLVDNDKVRVLEILHKPGAKEPMHSHPAAVSVYLSDFKLKVTSPDGKTIERIVKNGEVKWNEALTHAVENIGTTDQHVIMIELKK
jgi:beta-alanine degradation protein BauB